MLQSWHALKLQLGQKRPRGGARAAGGSATAPLAAQRRGWDLGSGGLQPWARSSGETPPPPPSPVLRISHLARVWGMRAWWLQGAAELIVGEPGEARRRQPRPEVSAAEVCVDFPAAPPERVGGTCPPRRLGSHREQT